MHLDERIDAFVKLGRFMHNFLNDQLDAGQKEGFGNVLVKTRLHNAWFTEASLRNALGSWAENLTAENLESWLGRYDFNQVKSPKRVGVVMAGNLPLVGFHDFLSILLSGHGLIAKLSSKDRFLLPYLASILEKIEPKFKNHIAFTEGKLTDFEAVIATGSNNTARYFEYYFKGRPNIIRKNRNGVAVLTGDETKEELAALGTDIFGYFGMGCRSVSKLFVPDGYVFDTFYTSIFQYKELLDHNKYVNNYDYNKAVYLMGLEPILDNGFLVLKRDKGFSSPIASVFYSEYSNIENLAEQLAEAGDKIQCVVGLNAVGNSIPFGTAQHPALWDYADGVDTLEFLLKI